MSNPLLLPGRLPSPVRGLLTPRLSLLLSPRSHGPSRPPHALSHRSERWSDRHWIANSIRSWMSMPKMSPSQPSTSEGYRTGNTVGEQGHARGVPPIVHQVSYKSPSIRTGLPVAADTSTSSNARTSGASAFVLSWEQTVQPQWLCPANPGVLPYGGIKVGRNICGSQALSPRRRVSICHGSLPVSA